jgi:hypothetical protein
MKQESDDLRDEYDFRPKDLREAPRGSYSARYEAGVNLVRLDLDVAAVFPDSESVNQALRALAQIIRQSERRSA